MDIKRKRSGHREKIGEKRVLVFHSSGSKTNWIMHEYDAACLSPTQVIFSITSVGFPFLFYCCFLVIFNSIF